MDTSTETLLIILITLLSAVVITLLAALVVALIALRRLINNVNLLMQNANEAAEQFKAKMTKFSPMLKMLRIFARKTSR